MTAPSSGNWDDSTIRCRMENQVHLGERRGRYNSLVSLRQTHLWLIGLATGLLATECRRRCALRGVCPSELLQREGRIHPPCGERYSSQKESCVKQFHLLNKNKTIIHRVFLQPHDSYAFTRRRSGARESPYACARPAIHPLLTKAGRAMGRDRSWRSDTRDQ